MRLKICLTAFLLIAAMTLAETRPSAVAGAFYPANKEELAYQIDGFLASVPARKIKGDLVALIVPHAGYPYSGQVAADAYKELEGREFDTVILMGASHKMRFDEIALTDSDFFETPLGKVPVDREFVRRMTNFSPKIAVNNAAHKEEHSIEVQLPFLQTVLKKEFKIVPVLFGNISLANCQSLAFALANLAGDKTLIIASSDWSHYYPYAAARRMDEKGTSSVVKGDIEGFVRGLAEGETEACGAPAVITAMLLAPALGANKVNLLKYANSGDVTGDKAKVVGYAAMAFSREETTLSAEDRKKLLRLARRTLEGKKTPEFKTENRGAFVTLTRAGRLRGCIGYILPVKPLYQTVQEVAVQAAAHDARFPPVAREELKEIKIEISALSRLKKVKEMSEIEIGRDGLYIVKGERSGLLLPQVAVEWGWDREQFLKQVSLKAGLPEDSWKEKDAVLYRFSAEVFSEK